jgi:hypothetical protein
VVVAGVRYGTEVAEAERRVDPRDAVLEPAAGVVRDLPARTQVDDRAQPDAPDEALDVLVDELRQQLAACATC